MPLHTRSSRHRRSRLPLLVALLVLGLITALSEPASAAPRSTSPKAITAMPSKLSTVRRDAHGKMMTQQERDSEVASGSPTLGNSDGMGTPADKTLLESDVAFRETNTTSSSGSNTTTASAYALTEDMAGIDGTPTESPLTQRSLIDQQYPSRGGHFLDASHMGVLDFKQQVAGNDAVFSLASPNQSAEDWSVASSGSKLTPGTTYEIVQGGVALTNSAIAKSEAVHTQATSTTITAGNPDPSQLWAMVDSGHDDGTFSLVNRADGLCLARDGQEVTIDTCVDDASRHWNQQGSGDDLQIFPVASDTNSSLGSDGGQGVADTLGANTTQTWTALALNEPGGSVPSWSTVRTGGNTKGNLAAPYDLAVGDLDGVVTQDDQANGLAFHDEAAVAWADADDNLQIRVIDYNANSSHLLVTAPSQGVSLRRAVGKAGSTKDDADSQHYVGDIVAGIGDFNGDGNNELAVGYQDAADDFTFSFWSYARTSDGGRSLVPYGCQACNGQQPFAGTAHISGETGYADLAVGDFDGDGSDDIALGFATWASATDTTDHDANLGVWTLNRKDPQSLSTDLTTRSVEVTSMPTDAGTLPRTLNDDGSRTQSGIRLAAGNFDSDPANGYGPQRAEIAIAYDQYTVSNGPSTSNTNYYKVEPVINIFSVATSNCNATQTTCDTATTTTNGKTDPSPLFPSHASQTTWRSKGTHFDPAPISLVAGGFGGQGTTDPPVDGLLASTSLEAGPDFETIDWYQQDAIVVPWSSKDKTSSEWTPDDTQRKTGSAGSPPGVIPWQLHHYTAYDRLGKSLVLGAPAVMDIEQQFDPTVVAAEPPTQVDWLNGGWSNISASSNAYLQTQTGTQQSFESDTSTQNSWAQTFNEGFEAKASWGTNAYFGPSESGYIDGQQKFSRTWAGLDQNSTLANTSWSSTASSQTSQDDSVSYSFDDSVMYRYPVLGAAGQVTGQQSCQTGCTRYYTVLVPKGSTAIKNRPGKTIKNWFQPSWSNMNALSYPAVDAETNDPIKPTDAGSYSYTDANGNVQSVSQPLYDAATTVGANSNVVDLDFSKTVGSSVTRSSSRTTDLSAGVTASGTVSLGSAEQGGNYGNITFTASLGYDRTNTIGNTATGTNTTTSNQSFELHYPVFDAGHSYSVATAYYYANDGSAKVVHGVDLTDSVQGQAWWNQNYGQTPDPALNLPNRIGLGPDSATASNDLPYWFTSPQRQLIRQFDVLQAKDDGSGLPTAGSPLSGNATAGQQLTFQVAVHNYSLKDMASGTTVAWYAVPVDDTDDQVMGSAISLGTSSVPAIKAQGSTEVQAPVWTALASDTNADQQYRIVVQVDPNGTSSDLHPLAGTACPTEDLEPSGNNETPALYDIMKSGDVPDPLGCGQDNQGYGLVTVSPPDGLGAERHATIANPARAQLAGGGLIDGNADHLLLTEKSDVPTIVTGQRVTGVVRATASLQLDSHPVVLVYDGPVADANLIGVTALNGIDDQTGGAATFDWTPDKPGIHELHEVLLSTKAAGQDDEQIMRVNVHSLDQYTVKAAASASAVPVGDAYAITGSVTPVPDTAFERTVQLQRRDGKNWTTVDSQQTSSSGRFDFDLTGDKAGAYTYRVYKLATVGRRAAASDPIPVAVGSTFAVTAKAKPATIKLGKKTTISGKVSPPMPTAADRAIELRLKSGAHWKKVSTAKTTVSGTYSISVKPKQKGTYRYRVVKPAAGGRGTAYSPTVTVTVRRK